MASNPAGAARAPVDAQKELKQSTPQNAGFKSKFFLAVKLKSNEPGPPVTGSQFQKSAPLVVPEEAKGTARSHSDIDAAEEGVRGSAANLKAASQAPPELLQPHLLSRENFSEQVLEDRVRGYSDVVSARETPVSFGRGEIRTLSKAHHRVCTDPSQSQFLQTKHAVASLQTYLEDYEKEISKADQSIAERANLFKPAAAAMYLRYSPGENVAAVPFAETEVEAGPRPQPRLKEDRTAETNSTGDPRRSDVQLGEQRYVQSIERPECSEARDDSVLKIGVMEESTVDGSQRAGCETQPPNARRSHDQMGLRAANETSDERLQEQPMTLGTLAVSVTEEVQSAPSAASADDRLSPAFRPAESYGTGSDDADEQENHQPVPPRSPVIPGPGFQTAGQEPAPESEVSDTIWERRVGPDQEQDKTVFMGTPELVSPNQALDIPHGISESAEARPHSAAIPEPPKHQEAEATPTVASDGVWAPDKEEHGEAWPIQENQSGGEKGEGAFGEAPASHGKISAPEDAERTQHVMQDSATELRADGANLTPPAAPEINPLTTGLQNDWNDQADNRIKPPETPKTQAVAPHVEQAMGNEGPGTENSQLEQHSRHEPPFDRNSIVKQKFQNLDLRSAENAHNESPVTYEQTPLPVSEGTLAPQQVSPEKDIEVQVCMDAAASSMIVSIAEFPGSVTDVTGKALHEQSPAAIIQDPASNTMQVELIESGILSGELQSEFIRTFSEKDAKDGPAILPVSYPSSAFAAEASTPEKKTTLSRKEEGISAETTSSILKTHQFSFSGSLVDSTEGVVHSSPTSLPVAQTSEDDRRPLLNQVAQLSSGKDRLQVAAEHAIQRDQTRFQSITISNPLEYTPQQDPQCRVDNMELPLFATETQQPQDAVSHFKAGMETGPISAIGISDGKHIASTTEHQLTIPAGFKQPEPEDLRLQPHSVPETAASQGSEDPTAVTPPSADASDVSLFVAHSQIALPVPEESHMIQLRSGDVEVGMAQDGTTDSTSEYTGHPPDAAGQVSDGLRHMDATIRIFSGDADVGMAQDATADLTTAYTTHPPGAAGQVSDGSRHMDATSQMGERRESASQVLITELTAKSAHSEECKPDNAPSPQLKEAITSYETGIEDEPAGFASPYLLLTVAKEDTVASGRNQTDENTSVQRPALDLEAPPLSVRDTGDLYLEDDVKSISQISHPDLQQSSAGAQQEVPGEGILVSSNEENIVNEHGVQSPAPATDKRASNEALQPDESGFIPTAKIPDPAAEAQNVELREPDSGERRMGAGYAFGEQGFEDVPLQLQASCSPSAPAAEGSVAGEPAVTWVVGEGIQGEKSPVVSGAEPLPTPAACVTVSPEEAVAKKRDSLIPAKDWQTASIEVAPQPSKKPSQTGVDEPAAVLSAGYDSHAGRTNWETPFTVEQTEDLLSFPTSEGGHADQTAGTSRVADVHSVESEGHPESHAPMETRESQPVPAAICRLFSPVAEPARGAEAIHSIIDGPWIAETCTAPSCSLDGTSASGEDAQDLERESSWLPQLPEPIPAKPSEQTFSAAQDCPSHAAQYETSASGEDAQGSERESSRLPRLPEPFPVKPSEQTFSAAPDWPSHAAQYETSASGEDAQGSEQESSQLSQLPEPIPVKPIEQISSAPQDGQSHAAQSERHALLIPEVQLDSKNEETSLIEPKTNAALTQYPAAPGGTASGALAIAQPATEALQLPNAALQTDEDSTTGILAQSAVQATDLRGSKNEPSPRLIRMETPELGEATESKHEDVGTADARTPAFTLEAHPAFGADEAYHGPDGAPVSTSHMDLPAEYETDGKRLLESGVPDARRPEIGVNQDSTGIAVMLDFAVGSAKPADTSFDQNSRDVEVHRDQSTSPLEEEATNVPGPGLESPVAGNEEICQTASDTQEISPPDSETYPEPRGVANTLNGSDFTVAFQSPLGDQEVPMSAAGTVRPVPVRAIDHASVQLPVLAGIQESGPAGPASALGLAHAASRLHNPEELMQRAAAEPESEGVPYEVQNGEDHLAQADVESSQARQLGPAQAVFEEIEAVEQRDIGEVVRVTGPDQLDALGTARIIGHKDREACDPEHGAMQTAAGERLEEENENARVRDDGSWEMVHLDMDEKNLACLREDISGPDESTVRSPMPAIPYDAQRSVATVDDAPAPAEQQINGRTGSESGDTELRTTAAGDQQQTSDAPSPDGLPRPVASPCKEPDASTSAGRHDDERTERRSETASARESGNGDILSPQVDYSCGRDSPQASSLKDGETVDCTFAERKFPNDVDDIAQPTDVPAASAAEYNRLADATTNISAVPSIQAHDLPLAAHTSSLATSEIIVENGKAGFTPAENKLVNDTADITQLKDPSTVESVISSSAANGQLTDATTKLSAAPSTAVSDLDAHAVPLATSVVTGQNEKVDITPVEMNVVDNPTGTSQLTDAAATASVVVTSPVRDQAAVATTNILAVSPIPAREEAHDGSAVTNEVAVKDGKVDLAPGEENPAGDIADITQLKDAIVTTSVAPLSPAHKRPTDATTNLSAVASILRGDLDAHAGPLAISEVAVENERVNLTTAGTDVTNNMPEIAHLKDATTETPAAPSIPVNDPQVVADAAPLATSEAAQGKAKETENPPPKREVEPKCKCTII